MFGVLALHITVWCRVCMILFLNLISVVVYVSDLKRKYERGKLEIGNLIENILKVSTKIPILRYSEIATFEFLVINQIYPVYLCIHWIVFIGNAHKYICNICIPVAGIHLISDCSSEVERQSGALVIRDHDDATPALSCHKEPAPMIGPIRAWKPPIPYAICQRGAS